MISVLISEITELIMTEQGKIRRNIQHIIATPGVPSASP